jgi:RNA recognition motif-containing protein
MNIFVGNLSFDATDLDVKALFEGFGNVASAVIVMRKEKKAPKSRGFGFVEMPDEQQALAAIAGLNGKEFMGRVIDVNPTRPKTEAQRQSESMEKRPLKPVLNKHLALKDERVRPLGRPGTYKGGRRTRSYMKKHGLAGLPSERGSQENPMRWRKRRDQPGPWQKSSGEQKPWAEGPTPIHPKGLGARQKSSSEQKPWSKSSERPQGSRFKGKKKPAGRER